MRKISELSTTEATDIFCEIVPYIEEIATDTELIETIREKISTSKETTKLEFYMLIINKISKIAPILLKKRREAVYHILGVLNGKSVEEVSKQNFIVTISQIKAIVKDKELIELFTL